MLTACFFAYLDNFFFLKEQRCLGPHVFLYAIDQRQLIWYFLWYSTGYLYSVSQRRNTYVNGSTTSVLTLTYAHELSLRLTVRPRSSIGVCARSQSISCYMCTVKTIRTQPELVLVTDSRGVSVQMFHNDVIIHHEYTTWNARIQVAICYMINFCFIFTIIHQMFGFFYQKFLF